MSAVCFLSQCVLWFPPSKMFPCSSVLVNRYQKQSECALGGHNRRQCRHSLCLSRDYCVCTRRLCTFFICVYISTVRACTQEEKYPVSLHLCLGCRLGLQHGADCWSAGMNGSRHLLSLVSQMEKGCTVQSEQSRVTNEGDIFAERRTEGPTDDRRRQGRSGRQTRMLKKSESSGCNDFCTGLALLHICSDL